MARLLLLADTHVPKRARDLPDEVWRAVDTADVVFHAGDWVDVGLLDEVEARARRLVGVWGNNDHGVLRERLPELARVELEGIRFGVVHETGPAKGARRAAARGTPSRRTRLRAQPHSVGHPSANRSAAAESRIPDRSAPAAVLHLPDRHCAGRGARDVTLHAIRR